MPESGCLDKNDELIDSIAKVTLAATSVTGVPWRRRTMDSWELAFGSNAGSIPSKVAAGTLLTRASMYVTRSQVTGVKPKRGSHKVKLRNWDLVARSQLPTLERGRGSSWEPRD